MAHFTIVGLKNSEDFAYVCYVAEVLRKCLPDFNYRKIPFEYTDWQKWILEQNEKNNWNHSSSPLVYKELIRSGGKKYYVGGRDEFWEYIYDYYGIEYVLSKSQIQALKKHKVQYYDYKKKQDQIEQQIALKDLRKICICDAEKNALALFIPEIIRCKELYGKDGLVIYIHNQDEYYDYIEFEDEPDLYDMQIDTYHVYVEAIEFLEDYMKLIDILIIYGTCVLYEPTDFLDFLDINIDITSDYVDIINKSAKRDLRIIVASPPTCFNATIITELVKSVHLHNVVAITADVGLQALATVSKKVNVPVRNLSAPPVYGFIDINRLVDIGNICERYEYFRPSSRLLKQNNTTLGTGEKIFELRTLKYLTHNLELWKDIENRKKYYASLTEEGPCYGKVRATVDLLKQWYSKKPNDVILSAGILTNGYYGITNPIVFSQPVTLEDDVWRPCTSIPKPEDDIDIEDLVPYAVHLKELSIKLLRNGYSGYPEI